MYRTDQQLLLRGTPLDPRHARAHVLEKCRGVPIHVQRTAALLTSELVTHALIRDRMPATIRARNEAGCLRVEVTDTAPALPRQPDPTAEHLRRPPGMVLVNLYADEWGVDALPDGSGNSMWFKLHTQVLD